MANYLLDSACRLRLSVPKVQLLGICVGDDNMAVIPSAQLTDLVDLPAECILDTSRTTHKMQIYLSQLLFAGLLYAHSRFEQHRKQAMLHAYKTLPCQHACRPIGLQSMLTTLAIYLARV